MITYHNKNIFEALVEAAGIYEFPVLAHGVNCSNGFGSGMAGQIAKLFPDCKRMYHEKYENDGWKLGDTQAYINLKGNFIIMNCAIQEKYGTEAIQYVSYSAILNCLTSLREYLLEQKNTALLLPKIGCGLAGGSWPEVNGIIKAVFEDYTDSNVNIYFI